MAGGRTFSVRVDRKIFNAKVRRARTAVMSSNSVLAISLRRHFTREIKSEYLRILQREMPPSKEIKLMNEGFVIRRGGEIFTLPAKASKTTVGTGDGGRFISASFTHVTQAVAKETPAIDRQFPRGIRVGAVNALKVNEATSFRWRMRDKKGRFRAQGKTRPFGKQYLQVLETGGIVAPPNRGRLKKRFGTGLTIGSGLKRKGNQWSWVVKHRNPSKRLWPEEGVFVWQVEKTVTPIMMFRRALFSKSPVVVEAWIRDLTRTLINDIQFSPPRGVQRGLF